jgi:general secretion pathway protein G
LQGAINLFLTVGSRRGKTGLTLIEVIIAMTILAILASAVIPLAATSVRRTREIELRRSLREMRTAIDQYKIDYDRAVKEKKIVPTLGDTGYPKELAALVTGDNWGDLYPFKRKYLRRIPRDPFDVNDEGWGMRSMADDPDSLSWGGDDIFDVYSQSTEIGLDGTPYNTW